MIRLLIADRHRIVRQGLKRMLAEHSDLAVVAEAGNQTEAIAAVREQSIDLAILDLSMPGRDGLETISRLRALAPSLKILVTTADDDELHVVRTIRAGATGYISKHSPVEELATAIRQMARGGLCICPSSAQCMAITKRGADVPAAPHARLSDREYKVFQLLVTGKRGVEIAHELCLSSKTVSTHKTNVLKKLHLEKSTDLYAYAVKHQLLPS